MKLNPKGLNEALFEIMSSCRNCPTLFVYIIHLLGQTLNPVIGFMLADYAEAVSTQSKDIYSIRGGMCSKCFVISG